ncbi:Hsp20/alpha crystallin family protein [Catalinimonas alkaloidigena]|nr:Hsp20/alpha crystallin family protein [Catalinimonas alkaloidigena]
MNLLENKELLRNLLYSGDLLHTINGGISMTYVDVKRTPQEIIINVSAPSVQAEAFNVMVEQDKLLVYALLHHQIQDENASLAGTFAMPMFSQTFDIPANVDIEHIEAQHEGNQLQISMPLLPDMESHTVRRRIEIKH